MQSEIKHFLNTQHLMAFCCNDADGGVYTASCYYAFFEPELALVFKSDKNAAHIRLARHLVAANIAKDAANLLQIEGAQIKGHFGLASKQASAAYYARFPFARLGSGDVFSLHINWLKYTNNAIFKQKMIFERT